eukprot:CAMPEP_0178393652 /NCGR_PEP_ID=MMETSP0689_2-20121128/12297_1 /TAXON_ID=160604 /ORGANISM="Amphidinium massartii, Strain CS-259" /LENGTH=547 /DNA_ID=CAMNT_0020014249 /DNA_START=158 /DNA_END=1801 /DNA_ORIENTATION=-
MLDQKAKVIATERFRARAQRLVELTVIWVHPAVGIFYTISAAQKVGSSPSWVSYSSYMLLVPVQVLSVYFYFWPETITRLKCRVGYAAIVFRELSIVVAPASAPAGVPVEVVVTTSMIMRFWMAIVLQDTLFVIGVHLALVPLLVMIAAYQSVAGIGAVAQEFVAAEVLVSVVVCLASKSVEQGTMAGIRAEIDATRSKEFVKAAETLLSSLCEAVVHLSEDLDIKRNCPRLSALLLHDQRWLENSSSMSFCDLMPYEDDKEAFRAFMLRSNDSEGIAQTMHTTLRDSFSLPVAVQLFHTKLVEADGNVVHLVGVRDSGGEREAPPVEDSFEEEPGIGKLVAVEEKQPKPAPARTRSVSTLSSISEGKESSDEGSCLNEFMNTYTNESDKRLWISTSDMTIVKCSPGLLSIIGQSALAGGRPFMDLVRGKRQFQQDVQQISNQLWYEDKVGRLEVVVTSTLFGLVRLEGTLSWPSLDAAVEIEQRSIGDVDSIVDGENVIEINFSSWKRVGSKSNKASRKLRKLVDEENKTNIATGCSSSKKALLQL